MIKSELKAVAKTLMFDLNVDVYKDLLKEFDSYVQALADLQTIDTTGVEPLIWVGINDQRFLRPDQVDDHTLIERQHLLANAPQTHNDYVALKQVVGQND